MGLQSNYLLEPRKDPGETGENGFARNNRYSVVFERQSPHGVGVKPRVRVIIKLPGCVWSAPTGNTNYQTIPTICVFVVK